MEILMFSVSKNRHYDSITTPCNYLLLYQHWPNCLSVNLQDFFDPAFSNYKRIWSLTEVPKLTKFVGCLKDVKKEEAVLKVVKEFDEYVVSNYSTLKKGIPI